MLKTYLFGISYRHAFPDLYMQAWYLELYGHYCFQAVRQSEWCGFYACFKTRPVRPKRDVQFRIPVCYVFVDDFPQDIL